uniref:Transthyretin-like family protein n=1 Tax=Steinernema glaseri TaxID=37863 RepID=A0A1I7YS54_9BILA
MRVMPCHTCSVFLILVGVTMSAAAFRTQSAAVKGVLMCGDKPLANTKVKLWDNDAGPDLDDLLEEGHTDAEGRFRLAGHTSELTTIDPILKIYHDCDDGIMPCQRKVSFIIPDAYVSSGATPSKVFDIGTVNMQIVFKSEERDCLNRA